MRIYSSIIGFCLVLFVLLHAGCVKTSPVKQSANYNAVPTPSAEQQVSNKDQIEERVNKGKAIAIANEDATKNNRSLSSFKIVTCERARLWVIIYDGGGPEYYIDKMSGTILSIQNLPQGLEGNVASSEHSSGTVIGSTQAIEIAKKHFIDFLVTYGDAGEHVKDYDAVACELTNAWRVFFEYREVPGQSLATEPNNNPPNYTIDKRTGKIIYTTHKIG